MSKYLPLWQWLADDGAASVTLTFDQVQSILGFPIDHSFLTFKKELTAFGYAVGKISMKKQTVEFLRIENTDRN